MSGSWNFRILFKVLGLANGLGLIGGLAKADLWLLLLVEGGVLFILGDWIGEWTINWRFNDLVV